MLSYNRLLLALGTLGLTMALSNAQNLVGNADDAKKIVETQCAACHGVYGEGVASLPHQAKLAGQHENYLRVQLHALKESKDATGSRFEMTMSPQASMLSDQDIANISAYYSKQPMLFYHLDEDFSAKRTQAATDLEKAKNDLAALEAKEAELKALVKADANNADAAKELKAMSRDLRGAKSAVRKAEGANDEIAAAEAKAKALMVRGEQIYFGGDMNKRIPACAACHSPSGTGNGPAAYPALIGQNYEYLTNQLYNFKTYKRSNDPAGMMRDIAERMSDAEIEAVATYIKYMQPK
ncbi:cytochrome c [Wohlfahrtiimonas sp. G9077]|uniref:c-type cytochrome n=1 Tax=Wohlfahrtiimonas sp. G9077 TaxID=1980118 RepID=UPI000B99685D|nr:c-type cytochrome [Wohlfahrtiimonas sp. G9077]OYQ72426.1 hypothetical protein B9T20_09875 [Wohlfahrtiimonas sp. G9077]